MQYLLSNYLVGTARVDVAGIEITLLLDHLIKAEAVARPNGPFRAGPEVLNPLEQPHLQE